jgi:ABC-type uncharacterized transport system substrate-binding protein
MDRRTFISGVALGLVGVPFGTVAQQPSKAARIGLLATASPKSPEYREAIDALWQGLRERGYVDGQNMVIEVRTADGKVERFSALAKELVGLKVDLLLAFNSISARAAQQATATVPIVVAVMGDPVGDRLVDSLAKPGGNVTGLTFVAPQLVPKRLALLSEALPKASRIAVLWHPGAYGEHTTSVMVKETEAAARTLGVRLQNVPVQGTGDFDRAFATISKEHPDAFFMLPSPMLFNERRRIVDFATRQRLPSMFAERAFVELGGLMSYGSNVNDMIRRSAYYVDNILKGAKPGDLPVEQPTKFELVINLKTTKAFGLTIPQSLLLRADEVIQ